MGGREMRPGASSLTQSTFGDVDAVAGRGSPGKRTLVEQLPYLAAPRAKGEWPAGAAGNAESGARDSGAARPMALPYREEMEASFGEDFGDIEASTGIRETGIEASAYGNKVAFANTVPSKFLVAHELAHVVQQRRGASSERANYEVGSSHGDDRGLEAEADHVASVVADGGSARGLVQGAASTRRQNFESDEHREIGDSVKGQDNNVQRVSLGAGYSLTHGEMVAMAGDYFGSVSEMRTLAAKPGKGANTREELEFVRVMHIHGQKDRKSEFSESAQSSVKMRYYRLAAHNESHFANARAGDGDRGQVDKAGDFRPVVPGMGEMQIQHVGGAPETLLDFPMPLQPANAIAGYRLNHVRALAEACVAGRQKTAIEDAMANEAFAGHYLTDSFSAGHLRTHRTSIKEHWDSRIPMFFRNLKGFIAESVVRGLSAQGAYRYGPVQVRDDILMKGIPGIKAGAAETVADALDAIGPLTFGDVVSGAVHDYDNLHGVRATVAGQDKLMFGDGKLGKGDEKQMAIAAVSLGVSEVRTAYSLGAQGKTPREVVHTLIGNDNLYAAERMVPKAKPDAEQGTDGTSDRKRIKWDFPEVSGLLGDPQFVSALVLFANEKAGEIEAVASSSGFSNDQVQALRSRVIAPLKANAVGAIRDVINWTPSVTDSALGHNTDDDANDYTAEARDTPGGLRSLTYPQRENLMKNLLDGATVGDDEDRLMDILTSASDRDARALIRHFGWDYLYDKVDDGPGDVFSERFPKERYGR